MTGFGKSVVDLNNKRIVVEVKSVNSKQLDLNIRVPSSFKEHEIDYRNLVVKELVRGKIDLTIKYDSSMPNTDISFNAEVAKKYFEALKSIESLVSDNDKSQTDYLAIIAKMPDVFTTTDNEFTDNEFSKVFDGVHAAISALNSYRIEEGMALEKDFIKRINLILSFLSEIEPYEKSRVEAIKNRIISNLENFSVDYDKNRFEQELIYYIEKLDITEEKVRLDNHCKYFLRTLEESNFQGKQLTFISQEIGREINTIGSKANNTEIQQIVVRMKDELEKIREQLANIL